MRRPEHTLELRYYRGARLAESDVPNAVALEQPPDVAPPRDGGGGSATPSGCPFDPRDISSANDTVSATRVAYLAKSEPIIDCRLRTKDYARAPITGPIGRQRPT